ncbi:TetR/AcrR family transcriptional regulator [Nonomuraea purpurea]|uniref:TetR/AcrR family transcriptional regulator n=1 Tax=Nonomuraea purpurea TaxID=1849276 RepID=A0ABV8GHR4_9ACTN
MVTDTERRLRADAARNAERILRTARAVFADLGPDAPLEEIARRADVRIRTLYNHFPSKADLVRAALDQSIAEDLAPAVERALADQDPSHGLVGLIEAAMGLAARELNTLAAARHAGTLTAEVYTPFYESLTLLARRAQDAGLLRADLVPDDLPRIMAMLTSTLWTMPSGDEGWRRYLALVLDGLAPAAAANPLPPSATLLTRTQKGDWLL